MRGEDNCDAINCLRFRRFTPICVGKTTSGRYFRISASVHPHMRGEDGGFETETAMTKGSPPSAWGRRLTLVTVAPVRSVHPHMRGED